MSEVVSRTSPASSRAWSATETVGLEMPTRREISARETGCPALIASNTVRSFSNLSKDAVAGFLSMQPDPSKGIFTTYQQ